MSEDRLLRELGDLAREEEGDDRTRLDERWDRLAAGTLSPEEEAELKALAETSPEAHEAWEAFRPLGLEFQARVVGKITAELPKERRLLPFRPAVRIGGRVTAAAAAAACLFVLLRSPSSAPALPTYTAELKGGAQAWRRGEEPDPARGKPVFVPGSRMELVARPSKPHEGRRLGARSFLGPQTGRADLVRWEPGPDLEISDDGAVRLHGRLGEEIQLARGEWTVWIVIGSKGRLPSAGELQSELLAGRTRQSGWQAVCGEWLARQTPANRPWQAVCANLLVEDQRRP